MNLLFFQRWKTNEKVFEENHKHELGYLTLARINKALTKWRLHNGGFSSYKSKGSLRKSTKLEVKPGTFSFSECQNGS